MGTTLHFVSGSDGLLGVLGAARAVKWGVSNTAVARITAGTVGCGGLVAIAPGTFTVTIDGQIPQTQACTAANCTMITVIRVLSPP